MCLLWKPVTQFTTPENKSPTVRPQEKNSQKYHNWMYIMETSFLGFLIFQRFLILKIIWAEKFEPWTRWSRQASQWCHPSCDSSDFVRSVELEVRPQGNEPQKRQQKMQESLNARYFPQLLSGNIEQYERIWEYILWPKNGIRVF